MSGRLRLCACLLNISEARNRSVVEAVAESALKSTLTSWPTGSGTPGEGPVVVGGMPACSDGDTGGGGETQRSSNNGGLEWPMKSAVLNVFQDYDYNRSVITIMGKAENIAQSVFDACLTAYDLIDLRQHAGGHPRLGAVDLVPIHPLADDVSLEECGAIAHDIASRLVAALPGVSIFLFGSADIPQQRDLVCRRKAVRWYNGEHGSSFTGIESDLGPPPTGRYGLTGVGAIPYVMNCNVTIATQDVNFGREIAASVRAKSAGGLPGVQSMAFAHEGQVEIACNVEAVCRQERPSEEELVCSFGSYYHVPATVIERRVAEMAAKRGIHTVGTALVGFSPGEARRLAIQVLEQGDAQHWRKRETPRM